MGRHPRPWTPEDDALLRELWPSPARRDHICEKLDRTYDAVNGRACVLGLRRLSYPTKRPRKGKEGT